MFAVDYEVEGFTVFILLYRALHFCNFCGDVAYRNRSGIH